MTLRKLGETLHVSSSSRNVIVRLESETRIGEPVMDSKGRRIGEVFDIFGPVDSPYASVKLKGDSSEASVTQLYLGEDDGKAKKKRTPKTRSRRRR
jgi:rRNA processing protein Gar1